MVPVGCKPKLNFNVGWNQLAELYIYIYIHIQEVILLLLDLFNAGLLSPRPVCHLAEGEGEGGGRGK